MTKKMNQPAMNLTFKAQLFFFDVPFNGSPKQKTEAALCIDGFWMMICFCCWCWCRYCFCCCRCSCYCWCWSYYCYCCCCCRCCCQYCCGWLSFCCRPKKPFHFSAKWLIIQKDRSFDFQWSYNFFSKSKLFLLVVNVHQVLTLDTTIEPVLIFAVHEVHVGQKWF